MGELHLASVEETLAYLSRRRAEGAEVTMSPRAEAFFRAAAEHDSRSTAMRLELVDDGVHIVVDVAVEEIGIGEAG